MMASEQDSTAPPTPTELLNAIALLCAREGILPPPDQPNVLGQVTTLLTRAIHADELAARYLTQYHQARQACYSFSQQAAAQPVDEHE